MADEADTGPREMNAVPKRQILDTVRDPKDPRYFSSWLLRNRHIWEEFERRTLRLIAAGRKRYSGRTIIESMRWDSDIREASGNDSEPLFKINDHAIPGLTRYFEERHPEHAGFFYLRNSPHK